MVNFKIEIARVVVEITAIYDTTYKFCKGFLTDSKADFSIEISESDIAFEKEKARLTDIREGRKPFDFSDKYLETLAVYRKIVEVLPKHNAFLFHGSAVAVDGEAYLFTAKSGTGKSTHVSFYREKFGDRAVMVNDDKPLILIEGDKAYVCGTPWCGKENYNINRRVELCGIAFVERDKENSVVKISDIQALPRILSQIMVSDSPDLGKQLELIDKMLEKVPTYLLKCNMNDDAATVSYNALKGND